MQIVYFVLIAQLIMNLRLVSKKSSNSTNFSDLPQNLAIVVVSDFGNFAVRSMFLSK